MSPVAKYQHALRELSEAEELWTTLIARLRATVDYLARSDPESFNKKPDHATWLANGRISAVSQAPLRHDEWPTADDLSALAVRVAAARKVVKSAWFELPEADRIGFKVPPA